MRVTCPGCGADREFGPEVQVGDVVFCASYAGALFRLVQQDGEYVLLEMPQASCPQCETFVRLPNTVQAGETFQHCGTSYVVTYAYSAFALEPMG